MKKVIYCEGEVEASDNQGEATFKHPRVFLTYGTNSTVSCPYCSHIFEKENSEEFSR